MKIPGIIAYCFTIACGFIAHGAAAETASLSGSYQVIDIRRASDVAGGPIVARGDYLPGAAAEFGETLRLPGAKSCRTWSVTISNDSGVNVNDPLLSDTQLGPLTPDVSDQGDRRLNLALDVLCDATVVYSLLKVDDRVLVAPIESGQGYVIYERALSGKQNERLQHELKDMKFFSGTPSDEWDADSYAALAFYAEYRGAEYRFQRTAITENLLDGLNILELEQPGNKRPGALNNVR